MQIDHVKLLCDAMLYSEKNTYDLSTGEIKFNVPIFSQDKNTVQQMIAVNASSNILFEEFLFSIESG